MTKNTCRHPMIHREITGIKNIERCRVCKCYRDVEKDEWTEIKDIL